MMKKIILIVVAILIFLPMLASFILQGYIEKFEKVISLDASDISKIEIRNGTTGKVGYITDEKTIGTLVRDINKYTYSEKIELPPGPGNMGYSYSVKIYDLLGEISHQLYVDGHSVTVDDFSYKFPLSFTPTSDIYVSWYYDKYINRWW